MPMKYRDLRDFIAQLEQRGELKRIFVEVSPRLEITEICDRVLKSGGPALLFERRRDKHTHAHYLAIDGVCAERARATISKTTSPMYRIRAAATNEVRRHVRAHFYFRFRERDTVTSCQIVPERDDGAFGVDGTLSRSTVLLSCASASSCRRSCMVVCLVRAIFVLAPTTGARVNRKFF